MKCGKGKMFKREDKKKEKKKIDMRWKNVE